MLELMDAVVFLVGFLGAFVGSVAAGSALVTVPVLLLMGLPPHVALGSDTLGAVGFRLGNFLRFLKSKNMGVSWKEIWVFTVISVPAGAIGTLIVVSINAAILEKIIGVILLILLPLIFLNKGLGVRENKATGKDLYKAHGLMFLTQMWSGFFAPGSGFFEAYVRMRAYGYTILQGKAVSRVGSLLADVVGVVIFALSAFIDYRVALFLFIGMFLGGYVGTHFAIGKGDAWIKPLLGIVIVVTAIKMLFF